jgi:nicotinamidase-related amidase
MSTILLQVGFRPGLPEVSERNKFFGSLKAKAQHQSLFQGATGAIHPGLEATSDDIFVTKHRVSAFAGTDLEMILRAKGIHTLVLFGISTSGAVLSTLLDAFDADYRSSVIADCCADTDLELHEVLVKHLFPARGEVISGGEWWSRWAPVRRRRGDMRSANTPVDDFQNLSSERASRISSRKNPT